MLSRIADSMYWMSRYQERAGETARLMEINLLYLLEAEEDMDDPFIKGHAVLGLSCHILQASVPKILHNEPPVAEIEAMDFREGESLLEEVPADPEIGQVLPF